MIQRSCPKNDSTKKSGLHPGTSCGAWPLPRASPVAVPTSRPLCRFTLALSPPKPLRTRTSPLFRLKLSVMIYLFLSPATTVGGVNPPFSCGMGQRHAARGLRRPRPRPRSCRRALRPKGRSLPRIRPYRWTRYAYPPLTFAADPIFSGNLPPMTRAGGHLCSSSGMPCNCASSFTI